MTYISFNPLTHRLLVAEVWSGNLQIIPRIITIEPYLLKIPHLKNKKKKHEKYTSVPYNLFFLEAVHP